MHTDLLHASPPLYMSPAFKELTVRVGCGGTDLLTILPLYIPLISVETLGCSPGSSSSGQPVLIASTCAPGEGRCLIAQVTVLMVWDTPDTQVVLSKCLQHERVKE